MTLIERMAGRYRRWKAYTGQRIRNWSVRRRWTVLVLIPALACGCGGTIIGAPLVWWPAARRHPTCARPRPMPEE